MQRNNFWLDFFFKSFELFWIFCRNLWHGSQIFIFVSRVKFPDEIISLFFFSEFFSDFERKFFQTFDQITSRSFQNYLLSVQRYSLWLEIFFLKIWTVLDFLQKSLQLFSNIYLRVQSKNSGRLIFFILLFRVFFAFWTKFFPDFWPENFKKLSKLPSKCPEEQFVAWNVFLKIWIILDFLQKTLQWFSNIYLRVQSKKSGRNNFLILLLSLFFGFWAKQNSDFWPKNFKKCQN